MTVTEPKAMSNREGKLVKTKMKEGGGKLNKAKFATSIALLLLALMLSFNTAHANPTVFTVKLNLHKLSEPVTVIPGISTDQIFNTTSLWSATANTVTFSVSNNYTSKYFYLNPKLAGSLSINGDVKVILNLKADSAITGVKLITELHKSNNDATGWTQIGNTVTNIINLNTTEAFYTSTHTGIVTTVESGYTIRLNVTIGEAGSYTATLTYDTSTFNSRIEAAVVDHFKVTSITSDEDIYNFDMPITLNITVADSFGLYDVESVKVWFTPLGTTAEYPSGKGTATALATNVESAYSGTWSYIYTHGSTENTNIEWELNAYPIDKNANNGDTYTSPSRIMVRSGQQPPQEPQPWWTVPFSMLQQVPFTIILLLTSLAIIVLICAVAVYVKIKR